MSFAEIAEHRDADSCVDTLMVPPSDEFRTVVSLNLVRNMLQISELKLSRLPMLSMMLKIFCLSASM